MTSRPLKPIVCVFLLLFAAALAPADAQAAFGFLPGTGGFAFSATGEDGSADVLAGSHPFDLTTSVGFGLEAGAPQPGGPYTDGDLKDLQIALPPGLVENPSVVDQCTPTEFNTARSSPFEASRSGESCPDRSQVGTITVSSNVGGAGSERTFGLYNLEPPPGAPSQLGASPFGVPVVFTPHVRQAEGEYGLTLELRNLPQRFDLYGFTMTVWGVPWSVAHNTRRGNCLNELEPADPWGKCSVGRPKFNSPRSYLSLPPSCTGPLSVSAAADSWQDPGAYLPSGEPDLSDPAWSRASAAGAALQGCDLLAFRSEARGQLTSGRAASPTGFDLVFTNRVEGFTDPRLTVPTEPKKAVVALPEGMTLNPSVAAGLGVCTPSQYAAETVRSAPGAGCPNASNIGEFNVVTPLFQEPVTGSLFLAEPDDLATAAPGAENPFDSLLAVYIVAKAPDRGIMVKVAGELRADPATGQLTATFDDLPQLPYAEFRVHFREGQRSPLLTPPDCGSYSTRIGLSPWLDPKTSIEASSPFAISAGIEGGPCPTGAAAPFSPSAQAGMLNSNAGSYTPFYLHLARRDTEAEITSYSVELPPGLLGRIAGIPYCPEAAIAAAKLRTGQAEATHPSCPAASEVGRTLAGYGVGAVLAYAPGRLYLAGPYHGSSFSLVAIDSATVGPFDLGTIVVRSAIRVDPHTARVSIDSAGSDPIPHIIDGIPIHLRDVRVYLSRPGVMVNPTSCDPFAIVSRLTGSVAPFDDPTAATASPVSPFQVSNCSALGFRPRFGLRVIRGSRRRDYPRLRATVRPRTGDANIAAAAVTLPRTEFLAQNHIKAVCTRRQSQAEACPAGSIIGRAVAVTPLLADPMRGPVYLRASGSSLPDLVASLSGQGIRILLEGQIDSAHGGLRARFSGLPDAPVTKFMMTLYGGRKRGILQNGIDLCAHPQTANARFVGQDNVGAALKPPIRARCRKHRRRGHHRGGRK